MKQLTLIGFLFVSVLSFSANKAPKWLSDHASNAMTFYGIGSASTENDNYQETAKQLAMQDLAQQIMVTLKSEMTLVEIEKDFELQETFVNKIQTQAANFIVGQERLGDYTDKKEKQYYVCYRLNRPEYEAAYNAKSKEIAAQGYEYLNQANQALQQGQLKQAFTLYQQGIKVVEDWLFLPLKIEKNGQTICVPVQLYTGLISVCNGLRMTAEPKQVTTKTFTTINEPIQVSLTRQGIGIANIPITAHFETGSGAIENNVLTDGNGIATFHLTNVTGKQSVQSISFTLGANMVKEIQAISANFNVQSIPTCNVQVLAEAQSVTCYLNVSYNDLPAAQKQIENLLVTNMLHLTADVNETDWFIDMDCHMNIGGQVKGEIYDLTECLVDCTLKFYDYRTNELLTTCTINNLRVLCNEKNTYEQSLAQCTRELMKRMKVELPKAVKTIQFSSFPQ